MRKRFLPILLVVSLMCSMSGCGKEESTAGEMTANDAIDFSASFGIGDGVDFSAGLESGDAADLSGTGGEEKDSSNRTQVQEDFVIVKLPTISYEDFGDGFYDEYKVDYAPLLEREYDEDGLLTGARVYYDDMLDPKDARITLSYDKRDGMVTACEISADMYAWYLCGKDYLSYSRDQAREEEHKAQRNMPYRLEFREPVQADPDVVKAAILAKIEENVAELGNALLPPVYVYDFYDAFTEMYQKAFDGLGDAGQVATDEGETVSYDEDGLLTGVQFSFGTESGEIAESWVTIQYEREGGQVTGCEINADMYSYFLYESGIDEEDAKEWSEEMSDKMPIRFAFDEPVDPNPEVVLDWIARRVEEYAYYENVHFMGAFYTIYQEYAFGAAVETETDDASTTFERIDVGGSIKDRFRKRMNGSDMALNYIDGGDLTGEMKIDNQPVWTADMPVSQEDIVCQIETEQDANGNLTLVHVYNDYASYDYVFTYDGTGRMVRYEYYEYPKGQSREAVGVIRTTEYSYDGAGRLVKKETVGTQANRVDSTTEFYYDDMGRLAARIDTSNFLGSGIMKSMQEYDSVMQSYEYDNTGKVFLMSVTVDWTQSSVHEEPPAPTTVYYVPAR